MPTTFTRCLDGFDIGSKSKPALGRKRFRSPLEVNAAPLIAVYDDVNFCVSRPSMSGERITDIIGSKLTSIELVI